MRLLTTSVLISFCLYLPVLAESYQVTDITWQIEDEAFAGKLVYPSNTDGDLPGLLMIPNWMGPTDQSLEKAKRVAGDRYIVLMADLYGTEVRPANPSEASQAAGFLRGDTDLMRKRGEAALEALLNVDESIPLDRERIGAIGFCFGGGAILELARSGAQLDGLVGFHGNLLSPTLGSDAGQTKGKILILHGAADPAVTLDEVHAFSEIMAETEVDWEVIIYSGAVHSFTNPHADNPGRSEYHPDVARRAFEAMDRFFDRVWSD
ncbi:MAG: dienelactone hydrolase family protein [Opitutales bacterium]|nr:dienelactone hydrolase family protein [Opitutales bacterium]